MKNKKNISFKLIFAVFGVFTALLTGTRLYQLFAITENDASGFFTRINPSVFVLYIGAAIGCIALLALVMLSDRVTASKSFRGKNKPLAVAGGLMAVGIGVDVALSLSKVIMAVTSYTARSGMFAYLFSNGYIAMALEAVFGLGGVIYFVLFALSYLEGKSTFCEYKLLAITPLFWSMARLIRRFLTKISFTIVADLLLELLMLAFMMMFFISFARISSQICQKNEMRKAMSFGIVAAMFAAALSVSRLVVTVGGRSSLLPAGFPFIAADLTFAIFAVIYIDAQSKSGRDASEDEILSDDDTVEEEVTLDEDFLNE